MALNSEKIISDLKKQSVEILTEQRLVKVVEKVPNPTAYIGFEPSGPLHIGHLASSLPVLKFAKAGFHGIILLADLHALANDKGELKEIQDAAKLERETYQRIVKKMGFDVKLEYRLGTDFEDQQYFIQVLRLSKLINFTQATKSMDEISRGSVARMTSSAIYPLMQVIDIATLGVSVAVGGMEQRKVHVMAIENLRKLGYRTPVAVHSQVLLGIDGKEKMSKSLKNTIDLEESRQSLEAKVRRTFCAPRDIGRNPLLDWYKRLFFPIAESAIEFSSKKVENYTELESMWMKAELGPHQLKEAVLRDLGNLVL